MRCAFLDLDHTIIRTGYREYLLGKPAEVLSRSRDISREEAIRLLREKVREIMRERILLGDYLHAFDWDTILPRAMSMLGVEMDEQFDALSLLLDAVRSGSTSIYEDSIETVRALKRRYKVCVMTGGLSKYQDVILRELGIYDLFDSILTTDRLGYLKVRPEAFRVAMNICNCRGAFHIGDSPSHDIAGAKQAGLLAFLIAREWKELKPYDPFSRVDKALKEGLLQEKMREDILYGYVPENLMIPHAILIELREIVHIDLAKA